ncbi:MAG: hypothetical protein FGM14_07000 [Flavobacteriales bacterium]|nr:hypothetical protein [Flavobacteriales bacterium]
MVNTYEALSVKTKHYQAAIEHKILSLKKALPLFESEIEEQLLFLKRLNKETISLRKVYARLLQSKEAEPRKSAIKRIENLSNMLLSSPTDALKLNLSFEQKRSLKRPIELVEATKSTADIEIPKIQILNCYTESYNKRLHAVNWRENQRIKEILISIGTGLNLTYGNMYKTINGFNHFTIF